MFSEPFTLYDIFVRAFDENGNVGSQSTSVKTKTDIMGPSAPTVMILTCEDDKTAKFKWQKPDYFNNSIDYYNVSIKAKDLNISQSIPYNTNSKQVEVEVQ